MNLKIAIFYYIHLRKKHVNNRQIYKKRDTGIAGKGIWVTKPLLKNNENSLKINYGLIKMNILD